MFGLRMKPLVGSACVAVLILALLAVTGCAAAPQEIDTERDIDRAAEKVLGLLGRSMVEVGKATPGVEQAIDGVDAVRREAAERGQKRRSGKQAKRDSEFQDKLCESNPCNAWCVANRPVPPGFCPAAGSEAARSGRTPEYAPVVRAAATRQVRATVPSAAEPLRERIKRAEGGIRLEVYYVKGSPHICAGHSIRENGDADRFSGRVTVELCETVLDEDIEAAQIRAKRNLDLETDAAVEACFMVGCNEMTVADVIAELDSRGTARGDRLAAGLR